MKTFSIALLFILYATGLCAQPLQISKKLTDIGIVGNSASSMAVQPNRRIVITGSVREGNSYKLAVIRYQPNGDMDNSFGIKGIDTFTVSKILPSPYQGANLNAVAIQADGKIIVAGSAWYLSGVNFLSNVLVMRLKENGIIDSSFGDNGTVRTNINSSTGLSVDDAFDIALQTDGKIVVAGQTYDNLQHRFLLIRYNTNGSVDNSFGIGGASVLAIGASDDEAFALSIQTNGKIVLAGESYLSGGFSYRVALARFTAKGIADNSFGTNGIVTTNIAPGGDAAKDVAIQSDGKIVIGGYTATTVSGQTDALCIRYNSNGSIDSSFNNVGKVIIDVAGRSDAINTVVIQPDNKILLGGYANSGDNVAQFLTVRLLQTGQKNISYGYGGIQTISLFQQGDVVNAMSLLPNGKILLAGQTTNGASNYISLIQCKNNGLPDSSFKNNGAGLTGIGSSDDIAYKMLRSPWNNALFVTGTANGYWVIAKYNASTLALDSSFGLNGIISAKYKDDSDPGDEPVMCIDAKKRKIYLGGYTNEGGGLTILRFNKNGDWDKTFGTKGVATYSLSLFYGGFGIEADGKILLCGIRQLSNSGYDLIARLNYNGTVDSSFGTNGEVRNLPITANSIQMKKDGNSILLGGRAGTGIGVLALKLNGAFDSSFGKNGLVNKKSSFASPQVFFKYSMAQDQSGNILLSGGVQGSNYNYQFSVTRFLKNGVVDTSFARKGQFVKDITTGSFYDNSNEGISSYCNGSNCSVLTSGIKLNDFNEQSNAVVMMLKNDGKIDSLNNNTGYMDTSFFGDKKEALYAALIDTVRQSKLFMFVAGKASNGLNSDFEIIRLVKPLNTASIQSKPLAAVNYSVNVTPNPAHNLVQVNYTLQKAEKVEIKVSGVNGNMLLMQTQDSDAGRQYINIVLPSSVRQGVYIITITTKEGSNSCRLVVL